MDIYPLAWYALDILGLAALLLVGLRHPLPTEAFVALNAFIAMSGISLLLEFPRALEGLNSSDQPLFLMMSVVGGICALVPLLVSRRRRLSACFVVGGALLGIGGVLGLIFGPWVGALAGLVGLATALVAALRSRPNPTT